MAKANEQAVGTVFGRSIQSAVELLFKENVIVTSIKVKYPGIDPLLIVAAKTTEGPKIAFIGGVDLDQVGAVFANMVRAHSVEWREDKWEIKRLAGTNET